MQRWKIHILDNSRKMHNLLFLKQSQPPEWLSGNVILGVPNPVTVTLHGEDGHVFGVPLSFLAADSSLDRAMLLGCSLRRKGHSSLSIKYLILKAVKFQSKRRYSQETRQSLADVTHQVFFLGS